jgi:hypothetical protein
MQRGRCVSLPGVRVRVITAALALLCVLAAGPAIALASGPSAGNQQYTDPFSSTTPSKTQATTTTSTSTPMPTTTSTIQASSPSTSPPSNDGSTTTSTTSSSKGKDLPYTGIDSLLAGMLGGGLLVIGLGLRRRADAS